jgi:hypothetical protein
MPHTAESPARRETEDTQGIPLEQLAELLEQLTCCHCRESVSRFEMIAIWPAGGYVGHLHCWAQHNGVIRGATS